MPDQELPLEPYNGLSDVDHARVEVKVADAQPTDLAGPQPTPSGQKQRHPSSLWHSSQVPVELVDAQHINLPRPLLLPARPHPTGIGLEEALLDGLLEDGLEQSVRVRLLGRGLPHPGVPR
jgi:hypothetical protein